MKKYKPKQYQMGLMYRTEWLIVGWHGVVYSGWDHARCEAFCLASYNYDYNYDYELSFWELWKIYSRKNSFIYFYRVICHYRLLSDILVMHAYPWISSISTDMHGYFGYACISAAIHGYQQICMDNPIIHGYPYDIHSISMDIRVRVGYPRKSVDIQNIHGYPKYKTFRCNSGVKGNFFQQPNFVGC